MVVPINDLDQTEHRGLAPQVYLDADGDRDAREICETLYQPYLRRRENARVLLNFLSDMSILMILSTFTCSNEIRKDSRSGPSSIRTGF